LPVTSFDDPEVVMETELNCPCCYCQFSAPSDEPVEHKHGAAPTLHFHRAFPLPGQHVGPPDLRAAALGLDPLRSSGIVPQ
jgi:hypothetical protein